VLSQRREVKLGLIPWYQLHWPRHPRLFQRPRLVTPRRALSPRFAQGMGGHVEQSDIALITSSRDDADDLLALLMVLNSAPLATWFEQRGKHKGRVREFFGRALEDVPLPPAVMADRCAWLALGGLRAAPRDEIDRAVARLYEAA
jgi:adenine-specific DNA-methyltransferase